MWRLKRSKHQFCSKSCEGKFRTGRLSPHYKGGLIELTCPTCGQKFKVRLYKKDKNCYCSRKCVNYIHGNGYKNYSPEFVHIRKFIRERDNYICQGERCLMTEEEHLSVYGRVLEVHHIDYDKENNDEDNLITTCKQCNIRANYNKEYWKEYFQDKLNKKCKI